MASLINSTRLTLTSGMKKVEPVRLAPRTVQAGHEPSFDGIDHRGHDNRNVRRSLLGRSCAGRTMGDEIDVALHQFSCEPRETVVSAVGPAILNHDVLALLISELAKTR
jgi:hypothetical protein